MRHASLFSGIGCCDLAAQWMGWTNIFQVEIDDFCNKVLEKNFPNTLRFRDVKQFDPEPFKYKIDILTGGFPCQPFSSIGKKRGSEDERYLWGEFKRIIEGIRPKWVVVENVERLIYCDEFESVCTDMENLNYKIFPQVLSARSVGAAHQRNRIFIVANANRDGCDLQLVPKKGGQNENLGCRNSQPLQMWESPPPNIGKLCGIPDGTTAKLYKTEQQRIKALGNAIVPQVAYVLFQTILRYEKTLTELNQ